MKCEICGKISLLEFCMDCQLDTQTLLIVIKSLKRKLENKGKEIDELKNQLTLMKRQKEAE